VPGKVEVDFGVIVFGHASARWCGFVGSTQDTGSPVNGAGEIMGTWKPVVNDGPTRCAKNPVNGVQEY
jgi:hypothetical protein